MLAESVICMIVHTMFYCLNGVNVSFVSYRLKGG